jgi:hypothetical protein
MGGIEGQRMKLLAKTIKGAELIKRHSLRAEAFLYS